MKPNGLFPAALTVNALMMTGVATIAALALYAIPQHVLRTGANDPQVQMAEDAAVRLQQGSSPGEVVPAAAVDMERSLAPFLIVYDAAGVAVASQATLGGKAPSPPAGVFAATKRSGKDRVTWQPQAGVRIAAVIRPVAGPRPGYVLAGRSLREVEVRETAVAQMAGLAWLGMLGVIVAGWLAFAWDAGRARSSISA